MSRRGAIVALAVIAGSLTWVATRGLGGALVYYRTPSEVVRSGEELVGQRIRLGGLVVAGSSRRTADGLRFIVRDADARVTVLGTGEVPALFREGQGVVIEGTYGSDGVLHADTLLVKHGSEYRPPPEGEEPTAAVLEGAP